MLVVFCSCSEKGHSHFLLLPHCPGISFIFRVTHVVLWESSCKPTDTSRFFAQLQHNHKLTWPLHHTPADCSHLHTVTPEWAFYWSFKRFVTEWEVSQVTAPGHDSKTPDGPDLTAAMEKEKTLKQFPPYGSTSGTCGVTCPTCRGTGRIPRGLFTAPLISIIL